MTGKIFHSTLLVAVLLLLCAVTVICGVTYRHLDDVLSAQLQDELILAAAGTELQGSDFLQRLEKGNSRLTWIAPDGTVLFDSHAQAAAMEDHLSREEIREALGSGSGSAVRYSDTLMEKTIYEARRLSDGTVLRISISNSGTAILFLGLLHPVCIILFLAIVLCALLSHRIARRIVEPLNDLDLDHPLQNDAYPELEPMLRKLSSLHVQTAAQLRSLRWKTEEFQKIEAQFNNLASVPNYPGTYIIGRYTKFAFLAAYNDKKNPVEELQSYIQSIDKEITRKREEFGLETLELGDTLAKKRVRQLLTAYETLTADQKTELKPLVDLLLDYQNTAVMDVEAVNAAAETFASNPAYEAIVKYAKDAAKAHAEY